MGIVLALLALLPLVFLPGGSDPFEPTKAALLLTGALGLLAIAIDRALGAVASGAGMPALRDLPSRTARLIARDPLAAGMMLFLVSSALSTLVAPRPPLAFFGEWTRPAGFLAAAAMTALFFASRAASGSRRWLERVARAAVAAAALATLYALLQLAGLDPIAWQWTATFDGRVRVPGTMGHPNLLGAYLAMSLPLAILLAGRSRSVAGRIGWGGFAAVSLAVLAATLSRGAWLGAAAGVVVAAAVLTRSGRARNADTAPHDTPQPSTRNRGIRFTLALAVAAALFAAPLLTPLADGFRTRLKQITDLRAPTSYSRLLLWQAGGRMLADRPLLGVGTDSFGDTFPRYRTPAFWQVEWGAAPIKAHSELVQVAATQGALGLAAVIWIVLGAAISIRRLARIAGRGQIDDSTLRPEAAVVAAVLAAWGVSSATGFSVSATGALAAALAGWLSRKASDAEAPRSPEPTPFRPHGGGLSAAISILVAVALWIPLVLTPWRAASTASKALAHPEADPARAEGLAEAFRLAPWVDDFPAEAGRTFLVQAFAAPTRSAQLQRLGWARGGFERAARIAPDVAEHRAFLARSMAAQAARYREPTAIDAARAALDEAYRADSVSAVALVLVEQGFIEMGYTTEGYRVARRCAERYPFHAVPMGDLGFVALHEGRVAGAVDTLTLALERDWHGVTGAESAAQENLRQAQSLAAARAAAERSGDRDTH